jgi:hypothetical protein
MAINTTLLIAAPMLQNYFVDKLTGAPLAAGVISFYEDTSRLMFKNLYYLSGSPGSYTYIPLDNPLTLSSVGTIVDNNGNQTIPFYYPYDEEDETQGEPYYVVIKDSEGNEQYTIQNFPNNISDDPGPSPTNQLSENFWPNGQFLAHNSLLNNLVVNGTSQVVVEGSTSNTSVIVAQGGAVGIYFVKPVSSLDTDTITFNQIGSEPANVTGNPRYSIKLACTAVVSSDTFKELRVRYNNVNRFSSSQYGYSISFQGQNNNPGDVTIGLSYIRYYGSGGSTTQKVSISTFTLSPGFNTNSVSLQFPLVTETIGSGNDDYIELSIILPPTGLYGVELTNFVLISGTVDIIDYPQEPDNVAFAKAIVGSSPQPAPDGSDLYLPIVLTPGGVKFDHSEIGDIIAVGNLSNYSGSLSTTGNRMLGDGSQYLGTAYSPLGIPYSRLLNFYIAGGSGNVPQFGTGVNFATFYIENGSSNSLIYNNNKRGAETIPTNGLSSPHFTFTEIGGGNISCDYVAYTNGSSLVTVINNNAGVVSPIYNANTSGITFATLRNLANLYAAFTITAVAASALANPGGPGKYFSIYKIGGAQYAFWFKLTNETAPSVGGATLVPIVLTSSMTSIDVAIVISNAINSFMQFLITPVIGSDIDPQNYFTFHSNADQSSVWYNVDGVGTQPVISGTINYIQVNILSADTIAQVASKTQIAINKFYFASPDLRGLTLRGIDTTGIWDQDFASRFSIVNNLTNGAAGTMELDQIQNHNHTTTIPTYNTGVNDLIPQTGSNNNEIDQVITSSSVGGTESRSVNIAVVWAIKY